MPLVKLLAIVGDKAVSGAELYPKSPNNSDRLK
jgi:hypothetical protein